MAFSGSKYSKNMSVNHSFIIQPTRLIKRHYCSVPISNKTAPLFKDLLQGRGRCGRIDYCSANLHSLPSNPYDRGKYSSLSHWCWTWLYDLLWLKQMVCGQSDNAQHLNLDLKKNCEHHCSLFWEFLSFAVRRKCPQVAPGGAPSADCPCFPAHLQPTAVCLSQSKDLWTWE